MYEIHISTSPLLEAEIFGFINFCRKISVKPIIIQLDEGEVSQQPMISKTIKNTDNLKLHTEIENLKKLFLNNNYEITRLKVEVSLDSKEDGIKAFPDYKGRYFEWHGKVRFSNLDHLKEVVEKWKGRISRNSLKSEPDLRFITLRGYKNQGYFTRDVDSIKTVLKRENIPLIKDEYEYCVFDSNKSLDKGWINTPKFTDPSLLKLLAYEGFLRRAIETGEKFILKGSLLTRQYIKDREIRFVNDLDFVYGIPIQDDNSAMELFDLWIKSVKEIDIDDNVSFMGFYNPELWRFIDYEMNSDFPTAKTDLASKAYGYSFSDDLSIDISWNLPIEEELVELVYYPIEGKPFKVPNTVPLCLQVSWKLHQTIVRPRSKDIIDLILLLENNVLSSQDVRKVAYHYIKECIKDDINPNRILHFIDGGVLKFYLENKGQMDKMIQSSGTKTPFDFEIGFQLGLALYDVFNMDIKYKDQGELFEDFAKYLNEIDLRKYIIEEYSKFQTNK